eukprot:scaffold30026_cov53-Attheya_sp.AAC.4
MDDCQIIPDVAGETGICHALNNFEPSNTAADLKTNAMSTINLGWMVRVDVVLEQHTSGKGMKDCTTILSWSPTLTI